MAFRRMKTGTAHVSFQVERWSMTHETYLAKVGIVSFASLLNQHQSFCLREAKRFFISSLVQYAKDIFDIILCTHKYQKQSHAISTQIC